VTAIDFFIWAWASAELLVYEDGKVADLLVVDNMNLRATRYPSDLRPRQSGTRRGKTSFSPSDLHAPFR
jgi:hypothetical protein